MGRLAELSPHRHVVTRKACKDQVEVPQKNREPYDQFSTTCGFPSLDMSDSPIPPRGPAKAEVGECSIVWQSGLIDRRQEEKVGEREFFVTLSQRPNGFT